MFGDVVVKKVKRLGFSLGKRYFYIKNLGFHLSKREEESFSQHNQDLFVKYYYSRKPKKSQYFFVDIGANDGVTLSNSYLLEKDLDQNWCGILIEADSNVFSQCLKNRDGEKSYSYNVALCNTDGEVEFMQIEGAQQMLSGIIQEYEPRHLESIKKGLQKNGNSGGGGI